MVESRVRGRASDQGRAAVCGIAAALSAVLLLLAPGGGATAFQRYAGGGFTPITYFDIDD